MWRETHFRLVTSTATPVASILGSGTIRILAVGSSRCDDRAAFSGAINRLSLWWTAGTPQRGVPTNRKLYHYPILESRAQSPILL